MIRAAEGLVNHLPKRVKVLLADIYKLIVEEQGIIRSSLPSEKGNDVHDPSTAQDDAARVCHVGRQVVDGVSGA